MGEWRMVCCAYCLDHLGLKSCATASTATGTASQVPSNTSTTLTHIIHTCAFPRSMSNVFDGGRDHGAGGWVRRSVGAAQLTGAAALSPAHQPSPATTSNGPYAVYTSTKHCWRPSDEALWTILLMAKLADVASCLVHDDLLVVLDCWLLVVDVLF